MTPPPGYVILGGPGAPAQGMFGRIKGLSTALLYIQSAALVISLGLLLLQLTLVDTAGQYLDGRLSADAFDEELAAFYSVSFLSTIVSLAMIVVLIIWSRRIASNLGRLGRAPITWKSGLTIVVWLLGSCSLNIITFLMLQEHWKASDPDVLPGDQQWKTRPTTPLIIAWFVASIISVALSLANGLTSVIGVSEVNNSTETLAKTLANHQVTLVLSTLSAAAAAVLLIMIVRQLSARHMRATQES